MAKNVTLLETVCSPPAKVDKAAKVIRGVKVLGRESANGYGYDDQAIRDAVRLYEDKKVCLDHDRKDPRRERGILEEVGILKNVRPESGGVYADLHLFENHTAAPLILERAEKHPASFGLSHNADGKRSNRNGKGVIESLSFVRTVDLVGNPATTNGLFESKEKTVATTIKAIIEAQFPKTCKGSLLLEDAGISAMPVETPDAGSSDDQIKAAFEAAVVAAFRDDSLDSKATLKKIKDILNAYDKLTGSEAPKPDAGGGDGGEPKMESKDAAALQAQITLMESREKCRDLLESAGVKSTPVRLKSLAPLSDDERKELVAEWKGSDTPQRPRTASPLFESTNDARGKIPTDGKAFAALCR